jgi:hypothetical protein
MEEILLTMALTTLKTVLASTDPKVVAIAKQLTPQLNEITQALVAAGYGATS